LEHEETTMADLAVREFKIVSVNSDTMKFPSPALIIASRDIKFSINYFIITTSFIPLKSSSPVTTFPFSFLAV
jgi:hypothetical protein